MTKKALFHNNSGMVYYSDGTTSRSDETWKVENGKLMLQYYDSRIMASHHWRQDGPVAQAAYESYLAKLITESDDG